RARTLFTRLGFVYSQGATAELRAVQSRDRFVRSVVHFDEREPAAAPGFAIRDDLRAQHGAVLGEHLHEFFAGGLERNVTNVQLLRHESSTLGPWPETQKACAELPARNTGADGDRFGSKFQISNNKFQRKVRKLYSVFFEF